MPIWNAISAKVDPKTGREIEGAEPGKPITRGTPCAAYIGPDGAGHYVKMVHNGIEYGLMQAYAEGYELLAAFDAVRSRHETAELPMLAVGDLLLTRYFTDISTRDMSRFTALSFLPAGQRFVAEVYADGEGAHWLHNPFPISISSRPVDAGSTLTLRLAPGGGQAIRIRPAE